jgi:hypothetical protein
MARAIFCFLGAFVAGASIAVADRHLVASLPEMMAVANAITIGRVMQIDPLPPPRPKEPALWRPNCVVTIAIEEMLRGQLPKQVKAEIRSDRWENPSLKLNDRALVFIGQLTRFERHLPEGYVEVFGVGEGFVLLSSVPPEGLAAIRKSLAAYRPPPVESRRVRPTFSDEAAKPFVALLQSKRVEVRRWAIGKVIEDIELTPFVEKSVIAALDDPDVNVQRCAVHDLAFYRYALTSDISKWHPPASDPVAAKVLARLEADEILSGLYMGPEHPELNAREIAELLARRPRPEAASKPFRFRVSREGKVEPILTPGQDGSDPVIEFVLMQLKHFDWKRVPKLPLAFRLDTWSADKPYLYLTLVPPE